jgi:hypothetical protein
MKNKFCMQCNGKRGELYLPISRVRGLPEALHDIVTNSSEGGVWSKAPTALGANVLFRVINNTAGCSMPRLIIFEQQSPELQCNVDWVPLPQEWIRGDYLHVYVSRGTLVPAFDRKRPAPSLPMPIFLPKPPMPSTVFMNGGQLGGFNPPNESIFSFHTSAQQLAYPSGNAINGAGAGAVHQPSMLLPDQVVPDARDQLVGSGMCVDALAPFHMAAPRPPIAQRLLPGSMLPPSSSASMPPPAPFDATMQPSARLPSALASTFKAEQSIGDGFDRSNGHLQVNPAGSLSGMVPSPSILPPPQLTSQLAAQLAPSAPHGFAQIELPELSASVDELTSGMSAPTMGNVDDVLRSSMQDMERTLNQGPAGCMASPLSINDMGNQWGACSGTGDARTIVGMDQSGGAFEPRVHGTKRSKGESTASQPVQMGGDSAHSLCSNDSADSGGSRDESNDSGSWTTGTYLIAKFTGFCAKLARKRRTKAVQSANSGTEDPSANGLKLSILDKLDALLEHGDDTQLARIEKSLTELHLERLERKAALQHAMQHQSPAPGTAHDVR